MDSSKRKPMTMAEMLPVLRGLLPPHEQQTITVKKLPPPTLLVTCPSEKRLQPMTIAEMKPQLLALQGKSPQRIAHRASSAKKKWNCSVKVENKIVSHTTKGQMRHNPVRKVLNFHPPQSKVVKTSTSSSRMTMLHNAVTSKLPKPELKIKNSKKLPACGPLRISGVSHLSETPYLTNKPVINTRMNFVNGQNTLKPTAAVNKKTAMTPKYSSHKRLLVSRIPETQLSFSNASSCESSFLRNEKEIDNLENKLKTSTDRRFQSITEVSPTPLAASTSFIRHRSDKDLRNNSTNMDNSECFQDDTIMSFSKTLDSMQKEESVIINLCDMFQKTRMSMSNIEMRNSELEDLLEMQKQTTKNVKMIEEVFLEMQKVTQNNQQMIEIGIESIKLVKECNLKCLQYINKLNKENSQILSKDKNDKDIDVPNNVALDNNVEGTPSLILERQSVIKSCLKSPSYKIPKKNMSGLMKKVLYKSMSTSNGAVSPVNMGETAYTMYMKMKKHNSFLNTPVVKNGVRFIHTEADPNTNAGTSYNLQMQLDKLYNKN